MEGDDLDPRGIQVQSLGKLLLKRAAVLPPFLALVLAMAGACSVDRHELHRLVRTTCARALGCAILRCRQYGFRFGHYHFHELGACPSSCWIFGGESDSVQGHEQTLSPLEDRRSATAAGLRAGLRRQGPSRPLRGGAGAREPGPGPDRASYASSLGQPPYH